MTCGNTVDLSNAVWGDLETFTHSGTTISEDRDEQWRYSGADTECHSVYAGQVNATGFLDIITVGKTIISGTDNGQIIMWNYPTMGPGIHVEDDVQWYTTNDTEAHSVFVGNVDADIDVEILSGGQAFDRTRIQAQLRIWYWS